MRSPPCSASTSGSRDDAQTADPHRVEVVGVRVARVARDRGDPVERGDGLVVEGKAPFAHRAVGRDLVEAPVLVFAAA